MNLGDLIQECRIRFRDEDRGHAADNYFSDTQWGFWLSQAQDEAVRRLRGLRDVITPDVCSGTVTQGNPFVSKDGRVLSITNVTLASTGMSLKKISVQELESLHHDDYGMKRAGGRWRTITGTPHSYIVDEDDSSIRLYPSPVVNDTVWMDVRRMPLAGLIDQADVPEISSHAHRLLCEWALKLAHLTDDAETRNDNMAAVHDTEFTRYFGPPVSLAEEMGRSRRAPRPVRYGGI